LATVTDCLREIGEQPEEHAEGDQGHFSQVMRSWRTHLLALFILVYVGVEVTLGGWTVTYIIRERGGGSSSGYISSGFFGGLALGRLALIWVNKKIGERRAIFIYSVISLG
jgi:fucose permease